MTEVRHGSPSRKSTHHVMIDHLDECQALPLPLALIPTLALALALALDLSLALVLAQHDERQAYSVLTTHYSSLTKTHPLPQPQP